MPYAALSTKTLLGTARFAFGEVSGGFLVRLDECLAKLDLRRGAIYWAGRGPASADGPRYLKLRLVSDAHPEHPKVRILHLSKALEVLKNEEEQRPPSATTYYGRGRDPRRDVGFE